MATGGVPPPPPPPLEGSSKPASRSPRRVLTGLSCASCGGTVEVAEGRTNVECRYCGTPQAVVGERGVVRLMVLDRLDRKRAVDTVRSWLGRGIRKDPALRREATVEEAFLAWFPFVRARLDAVGWVLGAKSERRKRGNRWETVTVPVEQTVEREVDLTVPAADMAEFGVQRVNLAGDEILPLDEDSLRSRGMVFRPSRSLEQMASGLQDRAIEDARRQAGLDRVTFSWLASVRRRVGLVFYPLWVVRYGFRGRTYQVLVDAEDGGLAYGKAPGNHLYRAACLVASCAGAAFVGTTLLQNLDVLLRSDDALQALALVGLVLAGTVYWGYRQFRRGGIVEEGSGLAEGRGEADLAATVKDVMERFQ